MASKLRIEYVRLRTRDANGLQGMQQIPGTVPVTQAVSATAWTGAGRVTTPATADSFGRYHAKLQSDVECLVSFAPVGDAGTTYNASATSTRTIWVPANTPVLVPIDEPGCLISAATGLAFA